VLTDDPRRVGGAATRREFIPDALLDILDVGTCLYDFPRMVIS
jgi:hypothetical protein